MTIANTKVLLGPTSPVDIPEVRAIAVITADGQVSRNGTSQSLGSPLDAQLLQELRWWSDVVLVGAATVRAENYGGVHVPPEVVAQRRARGQSDVPPIAVVTRTPTFDPTSRLFTDAATPPLFLTPSATASQQPNILHVPDGDYIAALHRAGFTRIVVEGGPSIYSQLLHREQIDVLHLTVDPSLALGSSAPLIPGPQAQLPTTLILEHCHHDAAGCVFLRYRVRK